MAIQFAVALFALFLSLAGCKVQDSRVDYPPTPSPAPTVMPTPTLAPLHGGMVITEGEHFSIGFGPSVTYSSVYWTEKNTPVGVYGGNLRTINCGDNLYAVLAIGYTGSLVDCTEGIVFVKKEGGSIWVVPNTNRYSGVSVWKSQS